MVVVAMMLLPSIRRAVGAASPAYRTVDASVCQSGSLRRGNSKERQMQAPPPPTVKSNAHVLGTQLYRFEAISHCHAGILHCISVH
jgi:hypothetical protein